MTQPFPKKNRWQPLRCGLLNLFRYDKQVFYFEDGHLLLRGSNGSGKSRVMALTLPFLFDGELDPNRMEPDRDRHKSVEWNLLMNKYGERTGYTWLELGRIDEQGQAHFLTLGCGLNALRHRGRLDRWFFITEQRVDKDLLLQTEDRRALTQKALESALEGRGELFSTGKAYRRAVNNRLFKLNDQRYSALINLLIELRQPQLSRKFDEKRLSTALSEALPPLPEGVLQNVADALRGLDQDRDELNRLREALAGTSTFLKSYRTYARIAARRRAEAVRSRHSRYEETGRNLKATAEELSNTGIALTELNDRIAELELAEEAIRARIEALVDSPEMRQARDLERLRQEVADSRQRETTARDNLERADKQHSRLAERTNSASQEVKDSRERVTLQEARLDEAAQTTGLKREVNQAKHAVGLPDPVNSEVIESMRSSLNALLQERRAGLDHLRKKNKELQEADAALAEGRRRQTAMTGMLDDAEEGMQLIQVRYEEQAQVLWKAWETWRTNLNFLQIPEVDEENWLFWQASPEGTGPLEAAARDARDMAHEGFARALRDLEEIRRALEARDDALRDQKAELLAGVHEPPPKPHVRDEAARKSQAGAPLWRVCDFQTTVPEKQRAPLEAALEASGLLDAWLFPDGTLSAPGLEDTVLSPDEPQVSPSLAEVFRADCENEKDITPDLVNRLLSTIGLGHHTGKAWIAPDGHWQVGPLHGYWRKDTAIHIGQGSRDAYRRQRLGEIEEERAHIEDALADNDAQRQEQEQKQRDMEQEAADLPDHDPLRRLFAGIAAARDQVHAARERVRAAEAFVAQARSKAEQALQQRNSDAQALGLTEFADRIDDFANLLGSLEKELGALTAILEIHLLHLERLRELEVEQAEMTGEVALRKQELAARLEERVRAVSHHQTLEETAGASIQEIRAGIQEAKNRDKQIRADLKQALTQKEELVRAQVSFEARLRHLQEQQQETERERGAAIDRLRLFDQVRLLRIALPELAPPEQWSVTATVYLARAIESELAEHASDDDTWHKVDGRIHQTITVLIDTLSPLGYEPYQQKEDGMMLVLVPLEGKDFTMKDLQQMLETRIEERGRILGASERAVLEKYLVGEVTQVLHDLLHECERLVRNMNDELAARPTSSGLTLKFAWRTQPEAPDTLVRARKLLMRAGATRSPGETDILSRFMQARIEEARQETAGGNWLDHLRASLDYRKWHVFDFHISEGGSWRPLNRRSHGEKSGGEKVTALMLLQLAAAAAHYRSAGPLAPRLILLDEAFVGVDDTMRAQCMGFLDTFDLDFMMTSERERGCYETLPGVAISQLSWRPGMTGIFVTQLIWNGREQVAQALDTADG